MIKYLIKIATPQIISNTKMPDVIETIILDSKLGFHVMSSLPKSSKLHDVSLYLSSK